MDARQRAELGRLAGLVYERELGRWLGPLGERFDAWERGEIDAHELSESLHEAHAGPAREVWSRHHRGRPEQRVAWGLAHDLLAEDEVDPALLELVRPAADVFRDLDHD